MKSSLVKQSLFVEHRLVYFAGPEAGAEQADNNGGKLEQMRREMQGLEDEYHIWQKEYSNLNGIDGPAGVARYLLLYLDQPQAVKRGFETTQAIADRFKREYEEAKNIDTSTPEELRQSLEDILSRKTRASQEMNGIQRKQNQLQRSLDQVNPYLKAIADQLEPTTESKLASLKKRITTKVTVNNNPRGNLQIGEVKNEVVYKWLTSKDKESMQKVLGQLSDKAKEELRAWAEPQLTSQQRRQRTYDESHDSPASAETYYVSGIVNRTLDNLSQDALMKLQEMPGGGGVVKAHMKVLEAFSHSLHDGKKDVIAKEIDALIQRIRIW